MLTLSGTTGKTSPGRRSRGCPRPLCPGRPLSPGWRTPVPSQDPAPSAPLGALFFVLFLSACVWGPFGLPPADGGPFLTPAVPGSALAPLLLEAASALSVRGTCDPLPCACNTREASWFVIHTGTRTTRKGCTRGWLSRSNWDTWGLSRPLHTPSLDCVDVSITSPDAELLQKRPHLGVTLPRAPAQPPALRCLCWCLLTQRGECGGELVMGWGGSEHLGPSVSRLLLRCQVSGQASADPEVPRANLG